MSQKFTKLEDAASKLGVSTDQLNAMREAGDLRAYRDGASWKFRTDDIDKLAAEGLPAADAGDDFGLSLEDDDLSLSDDLELDLTVDGDNDASAGVELDEARLVDEDDDVLGVEPLGDGDDAESILLADDELQLEAEPARPPSTIIGKSELSLEDDLSLAPESDENAPSLSGDALADDDDDLAPLPMGDEDKGSAFEDLEELELDLEAESSRIMGASDVAAAQAAAAAQGAVDTPLEGNDLSLGDGTDSDVMSGTDPVAPGDLPPLSGTDVAEGSGGSVAGLSGLDTLDIADDEQDDLVLGDADDDSSDLSLATSDSGINLAPSDSGLALDALQPEELGGSAIGSSLDLAALSGESLQPVSEGSDDLAPDGDFLLTPEADADSGDEDSSQVVDLVELEEEDDAAEPAAMSGFGEDIAFSEEEEMPVSFEEQADEGLGGELGGGFGGGDAAPVAAPVGAGAEISFPTWIMAMLGVTMFFMLVCGLMTLDLIQSMWAWDEPFALNSWIMDMIVGQG